MSDDNSREVYAQVNDMAKRKMAAGHQFSPGSQHQDHIHAPTAATILRNSHADSHVEHVDVEDDRIYEDVVRRASFLPDRFTSLTSYPVLRNPILRNSVHRNLLLRIPYFITPYFVTPYIVTPYFITPYIVTPYFITPYIVTSTIYGVQPYTGNVY